MAFYTGAAHLNLPRSPDAYAHHYFAMNAALPSIRPVDILAWSTWRPNHRINSSSSAPLTPPMTSTFESKSTASTHLHASSSPPPHMRSDADHRSSTVLPPITQLDRQIHNLPPLTPPEDDHFPPSRLELPKIATIQSDADFFEQPRQQPSPMTRREGDPARLPPQALATSSTPPSATHLQIPSQHISSSTVVVPPPEVTPNTSAAAASIINTLALASTPTSYMVDWLDFTRTRSAHFIAEKTCEMICYLWFSVPSHSRVTAGITVGGEVAASEADALLSKAKSMSSVTSLQLIATPAFVSFMQKLLETTQVSQSVIVLSLHYIHRLKEKNAYTPAQSGSEFRIAVTGLMMANKFLDDNTYTNKTWSEVSGISLDEINRMEREFLLGVDFNLYVDKTTYASWLNLLKGLVLAKERDARRLLRGGGMRVPSSARRGMGSGREGRFWHPHQPHHGNNTYGAHPRFGSTGPASRTYTTAAGNAAAMDLFSTRRQAVHPVEGEETAHPYRHRARSTSPRSFAFSSSSSRYVAVPHAQEQQYTLNVPPAGRAEPRQEEQSAYSHEYYQPVQPSASPAVPSMDYAYPSSPTPTRNLPAPELTTSTGTKRSAADAFASPPSSAFIPQQARLRRPASLYGRLHTLQIPEFPSTSSAGSSSVTSSIPRHSASNPSPLEGLGGFERMSLDEEERAREREQREVVLEERRQAKRARAEPPVATVIPQTLMAAYSADEAKRAALPKNLFFYTLASSPSTDEKELDRERLRQVQSDHGSSDAMGPDAEPEPYFEPRARKAKLRCQAAQPVKYGYNYADLNSFATSRYAPLYSYHEPSSQNSAQSQQVYVSTSTSNLTTPVSPTPVRHIPHIVAYPHSESHSHRQSHAMSSQPTAVPLPSAHGQLSHAAVVQSASASPASYKVGASDVAVSCPLPHFRDDVWARTPMPAQAVQTQVPCQSPSVCVTGSGQVAGNKWFEGGRQKEEQVMDYSDSPAVQTAAHSAVHTSSPYRHRYASANVSTPASHPGSATSSPYYQQQQQQQNVRRQILQDVPSAPFANAGPPGVGVQFYATPVVQQVHVQVPVSVQMPGVYNTTSYSTYSSSSSNVNGASTHFYSGSSHAVSHGPTYTYSGAHSTSNSPYHSAASGPYRYSDYGYPGQNTSSSGYRY